MRIKSGDTTKFIYFVGFADTGTNPGTNRMTGYSSKFTVRRSRDGGVSAAFTTPTINETDSTNMPGVYELLVDEDTTLTSGHFEEAYVVHINDTGGHIRPITREISLYRADTGDIADAIWAKATRTLTANPGLDTGQVNQAVWVANSSRLLTGFAFDTGIQQAVSRLSTKVDTGIAPSVWAQGGRTLTSFSHDTGIAQTVWRESGSTYADTGSVGYMQDNPPASALDTGAINQAVWQGNSSRQLTAFSFDTGIADTVWKSSGSAYADTGSLGNMIDAMDTGLKAHITSLSQKMDTGLPASIDQTDTGLRAHMDRIDTGLRDFIDNVDTGIHQVISALSTKVDTGVPLSVWASASRTLTQFAFDTGVADTVWKASLSGYIDTGSAGYKLDLADTGVKGHIDSLSQKVDTGIPASIPQTDTGVSQAIARLDTGLRGFIDNVDTGVHNVIASLSTKVDTGVPASVWASASRSLTQFAFDTGVADTVWKASTSSFTADTGSVGYAQGRLMAVKGDTGAAHLDGGRLGVSATATLDTGAIHAAVWQVPSGNANRTLTGIDTGAAVHLAQMADENDTGRLNVAASATLDTGAIHQAVWQVPSGTNTRALSSWDTGTLIHLAQFAQEYDTGRINAEATATLDTGAVHQAVWQVPSGNGNRTITNLDTGAARHLANLADVYDTGLIDVAATATLDTGAIHQAVWQVPSGTPTRALTTFAFDTGIADAVWKSSGSSYADTGSLGYKVDLLDTGVKGSLVSLSQKIDTGVPASIPQTDTGVVQAIARLDTGLRDAIDNVDTGVHGVVAQLSTKTDTGVPASVWVQASRTLTAFAFDTGVADSVWKASLSSYVDTGSAGYKLDLADTGVKDHVTSLSNKVDTGVPASIPQTDTGVLQAISRLDTGLRDFIDNVDTGVHGVVAALSQKVDTGVGPAVWANSTRTLTAFAHDTGIAQTVWRESGSTYTDTGSVGYMQDNQAAGSGLDTGQTNRAVWGADASRTLTAFAHDTGIADTVWKSSGSSYGDTGSLGYKVDSLDTGVKDHVAEQTTAITAKIDTGVPASIDQTDTGLRQYIDRTDTGLRAAIDNVDTGITQRLAVLDTGIRNASVEVSGVSDTGLTNRFDTIDTNVAAVNTAVGVLDTGVRNVRADANLVAVIGDTGVAGHVAHAFADTGAPKANITQVNSTTVAGTGDTGTGNAWGPA